MEGIIDLGYGIYSVDLYENDQKEKTNCYIIKDKKVAIVETCSSPCSDRIFEALRKLEISVEQVEAVIVTHIHLDHSGGAGKVIQKLPNAKVFVHQRGAKHLIHPERLIESAKFVYEDKFEKLFAPILPINEDKVVIVNEGDSFELNPNRKLTFYDSPGHALHHIFIHDKLSSGIFTGDSAGIFYREILNDHRVECILPATTPTQFDPEAMNQTLDKMETLKPQRLYYTHFGMTEKAKENLLAVRDWMKIYSEETKEIFKKEETWQSIAQFLKEKILIWLKKRGVSKDSPALYTLELDLELCAKGIIDYFKRLEKNKK